MEDEMPHTDDQIRSEEKAQADNERRKSMQRIIGLIFIILAIIGLIILIVR